MRSALKIFIALFFIVFLTLQTSLPVFAQTTSSYTFTQTAPDVPHDMTTLAQSLIFSLLSTATCVTAGVDALTPTRPCLGVNTQTGVIQYATKNGGLLGATTKMVAGTFTIPLHTQDYFAYLSSNFHGFSEKSYAIGTPTGKQDTQKQGIGYLGLEPLLNLWVGFRNVAYMILVIVFVVVGFAIMLRVKIDPRTVMTIQNQIPKIIIGIILVTFSFAIAALMIDLMYVVTYLLLSVVATAAHDTDLLKPGTNPINQNPYGLSFSLFSGGFFGVAMGVSNAVSTIAGQMISDIPVLGGIFLLLGFIGNLPFSLTCLLPGGDCAQYTLGTSLVSALVFLIVIIAVLVALWKLWIALLKAYLMILFHATLGPIMILGGIIPGAKMGFGSWMRGLIANLAIFPAVIGVFILGREFANAFGGFSLLPDPNAPGYFIPPALGNLGNTGGLAGVIAFAVLMLLPSIPDTVIKTLKAESGLSNAVGQGISAGIALPAKAFKTGVNNVFRMPDPMRQRSAGIGWTALLGKDMSSRPWQFVLRTQGLLNKGARDQLHKLTETTTPTEWKTGGGH